MFACREARLLLPRYVRGALSADDYFEMRYHLEGCEPCAAAVREARQALRIARSSCAAVADPKLEEVPDLLLSDIVLLSQCITAAPPA